jgi:hypothetical protein
MQITTGAISDTALKKIQQIVRNEQADCVVTSPMDKLETFFIRTVATAQQLSSPTSGAISTTKIGHFLAPQAHPENVLNELVSTSVSPEVPSKPPTTKQVTPVETSEPKPDEQLLSKLTEQAGPTESKPVVETKPVEPQAPRKEQIKKNILDRLTGRSSTQNANAEQPDKPRAGDSGNA